MMRYALAKGEIPLIEELGDAGIKILLYLLDHGEAPVHTIIRGARVGYGTTYRALLVLYKYNLIAERRDGFRRLIRLTPKGRKVAELLKQADELLKRGEQE